MCMHAGPSLDEDVPDHDAPGPSDKAFGEARIFDTIEFSFLACVSLAPLNHLHLYSPNCAQDPLHQMSGIEVTGLILGIIPILFKAIEQCQQSYEALDEWIHFRREFFKFSNDVRRQSLLLKQLILRTLASVTESGETSARMLENPSCEEWRDQAFTEKLRKMLSGEEEYETYYGLLQSVHGQLENVNCGLQKYSRSEPVSSSHFPQRVHFFT